MFSRKKEVNVYCDESCHLENDHQRAMVFGSIRCPKEIVKTVSDEIRELKRKHKIYCFAETKWKTVSFSKEEFYTDLLKLFLNKDYLYFRAVVFQNKDLHKLEHVRFEKQTYEDWYYKMFYVLLDKIMQEKYLYNIYFDKKNPNSSKKLNTLKNYLNRKYSIKNIQNVLSHESELIQLTDFLTGIISYANRDYIKLPKANKTKIKLVDMLKNESKLSLVVSTPKNARKINLFMWEPDYYANKN